MKSTSTIELVNMLGSKFIEFWKRLNIIKSTQDYVFGFLSQWTNGGQHNKIHINLKLMDTI
jgi:hypothetical protein